MEQIIISVEKSTRMVSLTKTTIGNDLENLQQELVFKFTDNFVNGSARLEYKIGSEKYHIPMTKIGESYTIPIKNVITKEGKIDMQLVIVEAEQDEEIPVFKSNVFYMYCNKSINAQTEPMDDYEYWLDVIQTKLAEIDEALIEVDNLDIDASKSGDTATISITNKEGTTKTVQIKDGEEGATGPANTLSIGTVEKGDEAQATITGQAPNQTLNLVLPKGDKGNKGDKGDKGATGSQGIQGPKGDKGDKGDKGATGNDGYSPTASVSKSGSTATITITDKNGTTTATVTDGQAGSSTWGSITGTLSDQTDLNTVLNSKVSNTDYASTDTGGVIKTSATSGAKVNASGVLYCDNKSYSDYGSSSSYLFISKGTLDNVIEGKGFIDSSYHDNTKQDVTDNTLQTTNKTVPSAINEVNNIAKGANQAVGYSNYSSMITAINAMDDDEYNVGQNLYVVTVEVPDLWVSSVESTSSTYTYVDDATVVSALETNGYIQVGYYKLSMLETQKVNLTNYVTKTDYATSSTGGVVKPSSNYGIGISNNGVLIGVSKTYNEYKTALDLMNISKATLENVFTGKGLLPISTVTQAEYDALVSGGTVDANTYYYIIEE